MKQSGRLASAALVLLTGYSLASVVAFFVFAQSLRGFFLVGALCICALIHIARRVSLTGRVVLRRNVGEVIFWLMILMPLVSLLLQATFGDDAIDFLGRSSFEQAFKIYILGVLWMLSGAAMVSSRVRRSNEWAIGLALVLVLATLSSVQSGFVVGYNALSEALGVEDASHLSVGDSVMLATLVAYALSYGRIRLIVLSVCLVVLFALGGRSAFFALPVALLVYDVVIRKNGRELLIWAVGVGFLLGLYLIFEDALRSDDLARRMLFVGGLAEDGSALTRLEQLEIGLQNLPAQALYGDPSVLVREFGSLGFYIHNLLSAWQFYGVVFFGVFVIAIGMCVRSACRVQGIEDEPALELFSILLIYATVSVVVAKSVSFGLIWLAVGFWLERISTRSNAKFASSGERLVRVVS